MTNTNKTTTLPIPYGDLLWSEMHRRFVRFVRYEDMYIVVADRNTMEELPDYCHPAMIKRAK